MRALLTPSGEIDPAAVRKEAWDRTMTYRMRGCDWAVSTSLARVFRTTLAGVQREAERDRDELLNRQRKLRLTLRESAILETSLLLERYMHGLAMPYDQQKVDEMTAKLNELIAQQDAARTMQAAE